MFSDLTETQMGDLQKNNKNYTKYDWVNTGVKPGVDAQGHPTWESTYSAYDPKDATNGIQISPATIAQWKDDGLFKYHPEYEAQVKPGKTLSFDQFTALNMSAQKLATDSNAKQLQDLNVKKEQAAINASNAETAERYAAASKDRFELKQEVLGKTQAEQFDNALNDLNTAGGDFTKLKPSSRVLIAESMQKMVPALTSEYKDILASNDPDSQVKAGAVLEQIQTLTNLGTKALNFNASSGTTPAGQSDVVKKALGAISNMDPDTARSTIQGSTALTPDQKKEVLTEWQKQQKTQAQESGKIVGGVLKNAVTNPGSLIP